MTSHSNKTRGAVFMTLSGLPLRFELEWPFRRSASGADFDVLHGDVHLEGSEGLHCLVAVQMTLTIKETVPSLEEKDLAGLVINTLRKEVDRKQLEFVKSPKRVPVPFSARQYSFLRRQWTFAQARDAQIEDLVRRKTYWQTRLGETPVWVADPTDAQYVGSPAERLAAAAARLGQWLHVEGEIATATPALMANAQRIESEAREALVALEKKHAFERA